MDDLASDPPASTAAPKFKLPPGFDSAEEFLRETRKEIDADIAVDEKNRTADTQDREFVVGKQWPDEVRQRREAAGKPCPTENYLLSFIGQVVGNRLLNETTIKVTADSGGTKPVAEIRQGLMANIQKNCRADIAYDVALKCAVAGGVGYFHLVLEEAYNDVFQQDIMIKQLPNSLAVVMDRMAIDPTGRDAQRAVIFDMMPEKQFKRDYPWATVSSMTSEFGMMDELRASGWILEGQVRIASVWTMQRHKRMLALFNDGTTQDITGKDLASIADQIVTYSSGEPIMREAWCKYAQLYVMSGADILEGPYNLPITRLPVFRVPGWELNVGEVRHRWGLVRPLKDAQVGHNYHRAVVQEKLMFTARPKWIASKESVEGMESEWRNAHRSDDALLRYNGDAANKPEPAPPAQIEAALIQEAATGIMTMRDISNIHEASLGQQSNEVSGKAIIARQRVGELGTVIYTDNLRMAQEECGRVMNELIPYTHRGPRVILITGADNKESLVTINNPDDPESTDITIGKYAITCTTGPSFVTRRLEAQEGMLNMVNAMPQTMALVAPEIVESQDWPGSTKIAKKLRAMSPPGAIDQEDMTPEMIQAQQQAQAQAQKQEQIQDATISADLSVKEAQATEIKARADLLQAQTVSEQAKTQIQAGSERAKAASTAFRDHLEMLKFVEGDGEKDDAPENSSK